MPPAGCSVGTAACGSRPRSAGDVHEVAACVFGVRLGPGDDHALRLLHHLREQHRGACGVGVDVEADGLGLAGLLDQRERVAAPPEVLAAGALVVGDDDAGAGAAADLEGLLHRLLDAVVLVAHVGDVEAAGGASDLRHRCHLVGGRRLVGAVDEPGAEAEGAGRHPLGESFAHGVDLAGRRRAIHVVHGVEAKRRMADQQTGIGGRRRLVERRHVVGKARIAKVGGRAQQVERRRHRAAGSERRKADPAVAGDHRGDALAGLGRHVGIDQQQVVVVGVGVDEAGRDDALGRVDGARCLRPRQITNGSDTVARDRDIGAHTGCAGAVDHRAAREEDVVSLFGRHRRLPLSLAVSAGLYRIVPIACMMPSRSAPGAERN